MGLQCVLGVSEEEAARHCVYSGVAGSGKRVEGAVWCALVSVVLVVLVCVRSVRSVSTKGCVKETGQGTVRLRGGDV